MKTSEDDTLCKHKQNHQKLPQCFWKICHKMVFVRNQVGKLEFTQFGHF